MSYLLTDAGESEANSSLKALTELSDEIDQLASTARSLITNDVIPLDPAARDCLDLAWYFAEATLRQAGQSTCGHVEPGGAKWISCPCCRHFAELRVKAERFRRLL